MYEIFEQLMAEKGVNAYTVSKSTGISTATLSAWKQGKYTPKPEKLQKIADYFLVSLEYLMTGKHSTQKSTSGTAYYFDDASARRAQEMFEDPYLGMVFDAIASVPKDVQQNFYNIAVQMKRAERGEKD